MKITPLLSIAAGLALAAFTLAACSNSILRNTAEAGLETVLESPLPTPTVAAHQQ